MKTLIFLFAAISFCLPGMAQEADTVSKPVEISGPGLSKEKPESGPFVEIAGGYMVQYTTTIPGTDVDFEMIPIPGGTFMMGSPESENHHAEDEGPQVKVVVEPLWMGKCEVTWAEYEVFMRLYPIFKKFKSVKVRLVNDDSKIDAVSAPSRLYDPEMTYDAGDGPDEPAATMSQYAAKQYTKYLSLLTGQYYRLPHESEWEYACRAGTQTAYHFGTEATKLGEYGWFEGNSKELRQEVGQLKPNAFGLYDMHGNVAEWVLGQPREDGHKWLEGQEQTVADSFNPPTDQYPRLLRGGSFLQKADACRSASRLFSENSWRDRDPNHPQSPWWFTNSGAEGGGFRLLRPLHEPQDRLAKELHWEPDHDEIVYEIAQRIDEEGKGEWGIVDPSLPAAIKSLKGK